MYVRNSCKVQNLLNVKKFTYDVKDGSGGAINPKSILLNFLGWKKAINFVFKLFKSTTYSDEKILVTFFHQT